MKFRDYAPMIRGKKDWDGYIADRARKIPVEQLEVGSQYVYNRQNPYDQVIDKIVSSLVKVKYTERHEGGRATVIVTFLDQESGAEKVVESLTFSFDNYVLFDNTGDDPVEDWPKDPDVPIGYFLTSTEDQSNA